MSQTFEISSSVSSVPEKAQALPAVLRWLRSHPEVVYCLFVVLLPVLAIPAFIALGKSDFFLHHGASVWVQSNDAVFNMTHRNCDVLIFGDSTAMTGIDPEIVEGSTGFHVCNISVTNAVLAVTGNLTLDSYLSRNPHPRVLVVQLSPDDFQKENRVWHHTIYAEGLLELLRHGSPEEAHKVLFEHPHEAVAFAGYAAGFSAYYAIKDVWFRVTHMRPEEDTVQVRNGFFTPPSPPRTYCDSTPTSIDQGGSTFARSLTENYRSHYSDQNSVVLVDVAPIPSCDSNLKAFTNQLQGVTSNNLQALPIGLFNDGRHYTAFGSRVVSTLLARQINQVALENPSIDNRTPLNTQTLTATLQPISATQP
ncbi:MAG: hypothetical protein PW735_05580 [Acidobacteriaceae bacterium]|nr:hypothetical protein [Acidobacteriaceae bacterium]